MPQTFESLSRKLDAARATLRNFSDRRLRLPTSSSCQSSRLTSTVSTRSYNRRFFTRVSAGMRSDYWFISWRS